MQSLTPQLFLNHVASGIGSSEFLQTLDRFVIARCADDCVSPQTFQDVAPVVRDVSYFLARDFLRRIPGPLQARLFGPERLREPIRGGLEGGRNLQEGLFSHDEFVIEVRCRSTGFDSGERLLPTAGNWEISLREMEEGLEMFGHLVVLSGGNRVWNPSEDHDMAFRLPSPGLIMKELARIRPSADVHPVYAGGLVSFRAYEQLLSRKSWPIGLPLNRLNVDAEGPQHPLYFLYHELAHAALRAKRPPLVRDAGLALLRAGLSVFPEVDGVSEPSAERAALHRFFTRMIELRQQYLIDHVAKALEEATRAFLDRPASRSEALHYEGFLIEAEGALRVAALNHEGSDWTPLWEALHRAEKAVQKHLEFFGPIR